MPPQETDASEQQLPVDVHVPMGLGVFEEFDKATRANDKSIVKQVSGQTLERFSRFCTAEPELAGKVAHPRMCGAMRRHPERKPLWATKLRGEMVFRLNWLVDELGGPKKVMQDETVILVQPKVEGMSACFFTFAACLSQSGPHRATYSSLCRERFCKSRIWDKSCEARSWSSKMARGER